MFKTYIGDSVYAEYDNDGNITLYLWNGHERKNEIVLEPEVYENLKKFVHYIRENNAEAIRPRT